MSCISSLLENRKAINSMINFGLNKDQASQIIEISGTDITHVIGDKGEEESELYNSLLNIYKNTSVAAKAAAVVFSEDFLELFGDWVNDKSIETLNYQGMPSLYYYCPLSKTYHKSPIDANANAIYYAIKDVAGSTQANLIAIKYRDIMSRRTWDGNSMASLSKELFNFAIELTKYGPIEFKSPIETGFVRAKFEAAFLSVENFEYEDVNTFISNGTLINYSPIEFLKELKSDALTEALKRVSFNGDNSLRKPSIELDSEAGKIRINVTINNASMNKLRGSTGKWWLTIKNVHPDYVSYLQLSDQKLVNFLTGVGVYAVLKKLGELNLDAADFGRKFELFASSEVGMITGRFGQTLLFDDLIGNAMVNEEYSIRMQDILLNNNTVIDLVKYVASSDSKLSAIANIILEGNSELLSSLSLKIEENPWKVLQNGEERYTDGSYDSGVITLSKRVFNYPDALILHEVIHGLTYNKIHSAVDYQQEASKLYDNAVKLIFEKYNVSSQKELEDKIGIRRAYGFRSVDEFFADLWTNSSFIKELSQLGKKTKKPLLQRIKDFLLNIIGITETSDIYLQANNLLLDMIRDTYSEVAELLSKDAIDSFNATFSDLFEAVPAGEDSEFSSDNILDNEILLNKELQLIVNDVTNLYTTKHSLKIVVISGKAGTGKTTVCPEIVRNIINNTKKRPKVEVISLANVAKNIIKKKFSDVGINVIAKSVAGFLGKREIIRNNERVWSLGSPIEIRAARESASNIDILFVDEASMLTETDINLIKDYANKALIVFIGDPGLLKAVSDTPLLESPVFKINANYKGELIERVRQSSESPILEYSDDFGSISRNPEGHRYTDVTSKIKEINTDIQASSVVSVNAATNEDIVNLTLPLVKEAHALQDPDYFCIITNFNKTREELNRNLRIQLLRDLYGIFANNNPNDSLFVDNIPYKDKEMVILYKPYADKVDNGVKGIVRGDSKSKTMMLQNGDYIVYHIIDFEYSDGYSTKTVQIPYLIGKNVEKYLEYLNYLTRLAKEASPSVQGQMWKRKKEAEDLFGLIAPIWALNVHKAQGSTYKSTYVPILDFLDLELILRKTSSDSEIASSISSALYTAMTRSSDATIFGYKWFVNQIMPDVVEKIANIEKSKKSVGQTIIEEITEVPQESTKDVVVTKDMKRYYDFIVFATGSDELYKRLATEGGWNEFKELSRQYTQRTNELFKLGKRFEDVVELNGEYDYRGSLKDPEVLKYKITPKRFELLEAKYGVFPNILKINIKPAQTIVPPFFAEQFHLGKRSLASITPEYFRSVNARYKTTADNQDLYVRLHNGSYNVSIVEDFSDISKFGKIITPKLDDDGYRLDGRGKRMYQLPKGSIITVDLKGNEFILILKQNAIKDIDNLLNSTQLLVSIQPLLSNVNDVTTADSLLKTADRRSKFLILHFGDIIKNNSDINSIKAALSVIYNDKNAQKIYEKKFADTLYLSFVKALHVSSSRIPTQALASFMDMQIAAFNPSGANDIFVSRWQMWLQGSDLDIDKSYLMGYSFSPIGFFEHWSNVADYSSEERRLISDDLSIPNGITIVESGGDSVNKVPIDNSSVDDRLETLILLYLSSVGTEKFRTLKDIINHFNSVRQFQISEEVLNTDGIRRLIRLINKHNNTKINNNIAGNILLEKIIKVCSDIANVQSAHSPIDGATSRLTKALDELDSDQLGSEWDGLAIYKLQEDNQTGKKVVGVMANALKAFLSITQYLNVQYAKGNINMFSNAYFLNQITIDGATYNMSSVANANIDDGVLHILSNALLNVARVPDHILLTNDDVSIILSAFVTLATDNAKELALAKLKASLNLASMHTYLAMMGVPFDKIVSYTAKSPLFRELYSFTLANSWELVDGNLSQKTWKVLEGRAKNGAEYTLDDVKQLSNLYNWAQELKRFTQLLGINQGMKSRLINAVLFKANFRNLISLQLKVIESRVNQNKDIREPYFKINSVEDLVQYKSLLAITSLHGLLDNEEILKFYLDKISNYIQKYGNTTDFTIDFERYFNDELYRNLTTDLYDIVKSTVNILDIINNLVHFYTMLEGLEETYEKTSSGAKGSFIFDYLVNNYDKISVNIEEDAIKEKVPYSINESVLRNAINFVDDYIISDFLVNIGKSKNFGFYSNGKTYNIDFTNNAGLKTFLEFFELLISRIKKKFPDIETFKLLSYYEDKKGRQLIRFNFNVDALDRKNAGEQLLLYNLIVGGFNSVKNIKINSEGLFENANTDLTIGDVFYLYNLIFNLGQRGQNSLISVLGDYIANSGADSLPTQYYLTMILYDTLKQKIDTADGEFIKSYILQYLYKKNRIPEKIKNLVLYNIQNVKTSVDATETLQKFVEAYRSGVINVEIDLNCN